MAGLSNTGLGMASFVLGDVSNFGRYVSSSTNAKEFQKRDFFYFQDTWRPRPSLTVNYGMRYELYFPESVNGKGNGALAELNGGSGGYQTDGYLRVAGYGNVPTNMGWNPATNGWNPRIGIAWSPDSKTVVRSGYGRSFDLGVFGSIFGHVVTQNLPVLANQSLSASTITGSAFTLSQGPAAFVFPTVPANGLLPAPGYNVSPKFRPNSLRLPTLDAWNLSVQRAITPTFSVTAAYVANKGTHNLSSGDGNNTNPNEAGIFLPSVYSVNGAPLHYDPSVAGGQDRRGWWDVDVSNFLSRFYGGGLSACTNPAYEAQLAAQNEPLHRAGYVRMDAGALLLRGRSGHGVQRAGRHGRQAIHARPLSSTCSMPGSTPPTSTPDMPRGTKSVTRGPDDWLRTQQLVIFGMYDLPFGKGKMWASGVPSTGKMK